VTNVVTLVPEWVHRAQELLAILNSVDPVHITVTPQMRSDGVDCCHIVITPLFCSLTRTQHPTEFTLLMDRQVSGIGPVLEDSYAAKPTHTSNDG
jgi:hypothetical protein